MPNKLPTVCSRRREDADVLWCSNGPPPRVGGYAPDLIAGGT